MDLGRLHRTAHCVLGLRCLGGNLRAVSVDLANELRELEVIDESECYIDANFAHGRGGGLVIGC